MILGLAAASVFLGPSGQEARLPVTADTSIWCVAGEREYNTGKSAHLRMKGIENVVLLDFDPAPLRGRRVVRARLRLKGTRPAMSLHKIGVSTVASPWPEGNSDRTARGSEGDSCFLTPEIGRRKAWAGPGSDFLDVIWGRGGTIWTRSQAVQDAQGWVEIPLDGRILEACAAGLSYGLAVSDDSGQVCNIHREVDPSVNPNHTFFSRENRGSEPLIVAVTEASPGLQARRLQVEVKPWPCGADFDAGGLEIAWPGPAGEREWESLLGYRIRLGLDGGPAAEPGLERRGALRGAFGRPRRVGGVSDRLRGRREALGDGGELVGPAGAVIPAPEMSRAWYHKVGNGWYADALVPLKHGEFFSIPEASPGGPTRPSTSSTSFQRGPGPGGTRGVSWWTRVPSRSAWTFRARSCRTPAVSSAPEARQGGQLLAAGRARPSRRLCRAGVFRRAAPAGPGRGQVAAHLSRGRLAPPVRPRPARSRG